MKQIVFLGMGKMGLPMAMHLQKNADVSHLRVFDVDAPRLRLAEQEGLSAVVDLPKELSQAQLIFSSLPNDAALLSVANEVRLNALAGTVFIDTSTVSVSASAQVNHILQAKAIDYLRVTVSGNNHMAKAAQLTVMASGPKSSFDECGALLSSWGTKIFYLGDAEQSRLMKLVVNLMIVQTSAMLAEGLTLGRAGGLDWSQMWQVISESAVGSPIIKAKSAQLGLPLGQRDFTPTFTVPQMQKDLSLMLEAADQLNVPLVQTATTFEWMKSAVAQGDAQLDYAAVIKVIERMSGLKD
jgi:3-hydroxyisobutyrate dehydrogenase